MSSMTALFRRFLNFWDSIEKEEESSCSMANCLRTHNDEIREIKRRTHSGQTPIPDVKFPDNLSD